jgi:hypothetical protein
MIRLRVEWKSESEARRLAFKLPPRFHINVDNQKAFGVLRYLCRGRVSPYVPALSLKFVDAKLIFVWPLFFLLFTGQHGRAVDGICKVLCQRAHVIRTGILLSS